MKIRILSITEAWELFKLIQGHFPDNLDEELNMLDFMEGFIDSISVEPTRVLRIVELLLEDNPSKIDSMSGEQMFLLILDGFTENSVFDLYRFFTEVMTV